jgi:Putative restriction endonuclease
MSTNLFDNYHAWFPGTKIELVNGQLIIGNSLTHSRRLLQQILRGWGIEAIVALAPAQLWWDALSHVFDGLPANLDADEIQHWANLISFEPDYPLHQGHGDWQWSYSSLLQNLRMAMFMLGHRHEKLGQSLGGGFVNRLGNHGLMPDVLFYRGQPRNQSYEYYLNGAADVIVEMIRPGHEDYLWNVKRSLYQQAGVPELWIIDAINQRLSLLRLIDGEYQLQSSDESGRYQVFSVPGLTFFPNKIWLDEDGQSPLENNWFEVAVDAPRLERIPKMGEGVDWSRRLAKFPVNLEPVAIAFEDYVFWCPEAKFEFANGRPEIGGRDGIKGLAGMLLMTLGLLDVVRLAHPRDWVVALSQERSKAHDPSHKAAWWQLAHEVATFLRSHYDVTRIAVTGDLVAPEPLHFWSELVLVVWGLPPCGWSPWGRSRDGYTNPRAIVGQLSEQPLIQLIDGNRELTMAEAQILWAVECIFLDSDFG